MGCLAQVCVWGLERKEEVIACNGYPGRCSYRQAMNERRDCLCLLISLGLPISALTTADRLNSVLLKQLETFQEQAIEQANARHVKQLTT